jgi:CheY-like chemotaxis protein
VISDTGHGMSPEVRAHIFEPFFTTKEAGKGTGLGLATVHGIVRQSGGHISVYSEPGQGTSFKICFPVAADGPADAVAIAPAAKPPRGSETLLVVEDEPALGEIVRIGLEAAGYTVLLAGNAGEALALSDAHLGPIDLLITDVVMPGLGGSALAVKLTEGRPLLKTLFMSGFTDDAVVLHGVQTESMAFIEKPFTAAALARKVRAVLDAKSNHDPER